MVSRCKWTRADVTCVQLPPVDAVEEGVRSDLVTASVLETHPLTNLSRQEPLAEQLGVLTEVVRILHLSR